MSKRTFKNTYIVLFGDFDNGKFVKFSKFKTADDFKKYLNKKHLSYDAGEGMFVNENDEDRSSCFCICEKKYYEDTGYIADWDHIILQDYLNDRESGITWGEDCESVWFACGSYFKSDDENLEACFNDLKSIDGIEIELELPEHWNMSEIIEDAEYGEYMYGDVFNEWVAVSNDNVSRNSNESADQNDNSGIEFVNWDAVDKMLHEQNGKWPVAF
jgi:hypothetical protein